MNVQYRKVLLNQPLELFGSHLSVNPGNENRMLPDTKARVRAGHFKLVFTHQP